MVRAGSVIPLDSVVAEGEINVNQASLTGESVPVAKRPGGAVYAGTVVEEGESVLEVKQASGQSRYDQIVEMIQRSSPPPRPKPPAWQTSWCPIPLPAAWRALRSPGT